VVYVTSAHTSSRLSTTDIGRKLGAASRPVGYKGQGWRRASAWRWRAINGCSAQWRWTTSIYWRTSVQQRRRSGRGLLDAGVARDVIEALVVRKRERNVDWKMTFNTTSSDRHRLLQICRRSSSTVI